VSTRRLSSESGYSLTELLVSTAIMMVVTGSIFGLMNPAQGTAKAQPEVSDMQQRARLGADTLFKELVIAGAGPYQGSTTGSLINFFAPVVPRRMGRLNPDTSDVFRPDAITLSYIPNSYSQTTIDGAMPPNSVELKTNGQPNCPLKGGQKDPLCGFEEGMVVIIFDKSGHYDTFEITQVQTSAHLQHRNQTLNHEYASGSSVTQIVSNTYYRDASTNKLMRYNGGSSDVAIVDDVVDLQFEYFGDPNPPTQPKPEIGTANCLYDAMGNYIGPGTMAADEGSLSILSAADLTDGPMCGSGTTEFDVDLLRVRKVRVSLRVQATSEAMRGVDTLLFKNPGKSRGGETFVPDYNVRFEVSPRNLNLVR
jgi:hypothetical protein